jgi:hypothetical protein
VTPREIAARLPKAQRRAVLALDGVTFRDWQTVYRQRRQRISVHALGLTEPYSEGPVTMWCSIRLTPLGLEVQAEVRALAEKQL